MKWGVLLRGHGDMGTRGDALFVYEYFDYDFGDIYRNGLRWKKIVIHQRYYLCG